MKRQTIFAGMLLFAIYYSASAYGPIGHDVGLYSRTAHIVELSNYAPACVVAKDFHVTPSALHEPIFMLNKRHYSWPKTENNFCSGKLRVREGKNRGPPKV